MPTDNFEDYIRDHRDEFDGEAPAPDLWSRIKDSIEESDDEDDPLAEFILANREAFDNVTPPPRIAGEIFAALPVAEAKRLPLRPRRFKLGIIMSIAASMALLLSVGWFMGNRSGYQSGQEDQVAAQLREISPELLETETFYQKEIATQFTKVNLINQDPQLRLDLKEMDKATEEIRQELVKVPVSQRAELINQLIATYQTKLDILVRIQQHVSPSPTIGSQNQTDNENI